MLENEPSSGADGTAGTTETTESDWPITTATPQTDEVRVNAPGERSGGVRLAGPPPEPEPVVATPDTPLTTIAGDVELDDEAEPVTDEGVAPPEEGSGGDESPPDENAGQDAGADGGGTTVQPPMVLFQPPVAHTVPASSAPAEGGTTAATGSEGGDDDTAETSTGGPADSTTDDDGSDEERPSRRRRRRGGRGRGKSRTGDEGADTEAGADTDTAAASGTASTGTDTETARSGGAGRGTSDAERATESTRDSEGAGREAAEATEENRPTRRRRRRRRSSSETVEGTTTGDDPPDTIVKVREPRLEKQEKQTEDEVKSVKGSTRLEAKKQRRREGREQGRRRAPVITESEFLARRESVKRDLVIRRNGDRTQIAVLEDDVLVEHYVDRAAHKSYVGNVYLGRVQNVLPSMEAAFVDIGKGRNAVLYAGEVNWDASGLEGQPKRIESVLKSGQSVLVQVTKDPMGHKGARLTSQISLPGRYLVYVPDGSMTGISRKLPDKERARLKQILKKVMPENAGVIVRTAAEGASEEELERDISRLASQWESIKRKSKSATAPSLLSSEPDLTIRVVRDVFNEDFASLVVSGEPAWNTVKEYVDYVAPHLAERLTHWDGDRDIFEAYRVDEQISKALERKVWLPSGGSLIFDRTEAMTVVDVNTGKFTGQGGNLEETVTKNNLEAAEEIVRQLRLRDIGGIIVIDFIDMVLESNRELVLRRMLECLSRDRTKHQVAEVTSLGLVQMTRKRVGQGLLEAFSHTCDHCNGRGLMLSTEPGEPKGGSGSGGGNGKKKKSKSGSDKTEKAAKAESAESAEATAESPTSGGEQESTAAEADSGGASTGEGGTTPTKSTSRQTTKGATRKSGTKSSRKTKKEAETGTAATEPAAEAAGSAASESAGTESGEEDESGAERPRRRRTRRTKASGTGSESASASAVAEAG
ncbi:Rne/Rng family ribonuclease [Halostreptopolyspora alba]|uniref:Ribonuclease E n=1 Tax=Halostreptopolyspora alba TaxID=2487137 RepID=A0A3N0EHI1_9ACTN|nr:ribonuclease E/G [Nocardiopsaceae bacterium YIM 96095]